MSDYDNNLTGVLFVNDKQGNEKRPDYKGSAEIDGVQYWVSGWKKMTSKGQTLSMKYERKEQRPAVAPSTQQPAPAYDEDIPF